MRFLLLGLLALLCALEVTAQNKKIGITLQLSSPSNDDVRLGWFNIDNESVDDYNLRHKSFAMGLLINYNIREETTLRLRVGISRQFINEYRDKYISAVRYIESNKGEQTKFQIAPGVIWKMNRNNLDLYGGFELPINLHGQFTMNLDYTGIDSLSGNVLFEGRNITTLPSGYSVGIGAIMGFNYFPIKHFSVGAEFSPSLLYAQLSGTTRSERYSTIPTAPVVTNFTLDEDAGYTFYDQRFSINFSFWF